MKTWNIAVLAGDGIGPEIMAEALKVLELIEQRNALRFELSEAAFGGCAPPAGESFTDPVWEYLHFGGINFGRSITGGYVYRGAEMVHNRGRYFYADFIPGRVASLEIDFETGAASDFIEHSSELGSLGNISAFGRDADGELYILSFNGNIYRVRGTITPGDTNRDGVVDSADLGNMLANWGSGDCGVTDLNNDEDVDSADLGTLLANWGMTTN